MRKIRSAFAVAALGLIAAPAVAQERAFVVQVLGGGYSHTANLNTGAPFAHFKTGFNLGGAMGVQVNKYVAFHGDFTFARTKALGAVAFDGKLVNRFFYGGHLELRYPVTEQFAPFLFGGAGGVTVDQNGPESAEQFHHFTKVAGMFGAGLSYQIPGSGVELLAEGKALTYKWVAAPFNRQQWDITYSVGLAYRFGF